MRSRAALVLKSMGSCSASTTSTSHLEEPFIHNLTGTHDITLMLKFRLPRPGRLDLRRGVLYEGTIFHISHTFAHINAFHTCSFTLTQSLGVISKILKHTRARMDRHPCPHSTTSLQAHYRYSASPVTAATHITLSDYLRRRGD